MLPQLQAERQLLAIEACSVPHMAETSRLAVLNRHARRIEGTRTPQSALEALQRLPIPVRHVPKRQVS
jgi:hypothetical protein